MIVFQLYIFESVEDGSYFDPYPMHNVVHAIIIIINMFVYTNTYMHIRMYIAP